MRRGSCGFLNGDAIAESLELTEVSTHRAVGVSLREGGGAEFVIGHAVSHDVVRDFENLMPHRDDGLFYGHDAA